MADQTTNLRVRISADLADIRQGLGLLTNQLATVKKQAATPLPANNAVNQLGVSAGQTANAMRQLPAQFTDIVTSLQGGMPFTTVLLQQGGQIRDSFGSIGGAIKGVGAGLLGLVNPATVAAAVLGVLAVAAYKGGQENQAYADALVLTGNYADRTAGQLGVMAARLDDLEGVTRGGAAKALAEIASAGQFTGEQFDLAAEAAVQWEGATGRAIDETVKDFDKIAKDPVKGLLALNEQYHFLTEAQLEHIRTLVEEGKQQEAVTEAFRVYHDTLAERVPQLTENLGYLQKAMRGVKEIAAQMWDVVLGVGRDFTLDDKVANLQERLALLNDPKYLPGLSQAGRAAQIAALQKQLDTARQQLAGQNMKWIDGSSPVVDNAADSARQSWKDITERLLPEAEKRTKAIAAIQAAGDKAHIAQAQIDAQIARQRAEWAKQDAKKGGAAGNATRSAALQGYKDALAQEQAQLKADTDALKAQYDAREITVEEYYSRLRTLSQQGTDAQAAALEKQIAYLKRQNVTGKDAVAVNKEIAQLEARLAVVRTQGAAALVKLESAEASATEARRQAIQAYADALQDSNTALQRQMTTLAARAGMGEREYEIQQQINKALEDQSDARDRLQRQLANRQIDKTTYDADLAALGASTTRRIAIVRQGYADLATAEADWHNGANAAWADYAQNTANLAGQVEDAVNGAFSGMEDALVTFVTTGKLSFADLADSIIKDLARIAAKQLITGLLGNLFAGAAGNATTARAQSTGNYGAFNPNVSGWNKYATGGYTGAGGVFEPAGIVHKGEGVLSQLDIAAIGGPAGFHALLSTIRRGRGYAEGGLVGAGTAAAGGRLMASATKSINVPITVNITNGQATSSTGGDQDRAARELGNSVRDVVTEELVKQSRPGGLIWNIGVGR